MTDNNNTFNELDEINQCFQAIADLMNPRCDLQERQRDNVAILMGYLTHRANEIRDKNS